MIAYANANFINLKLDAEKGAGIELAQRFKVPGYPTIIFLNGEGEEVDRILGYRPAPEFLLEIDRINNNLGTVEHLLEQVTEDPDNNTAVRTLAEKYQDRGDDASALYYWDMLLNNTGAGNSLALYQVAACRARLDKSAWPLIQFISAYPGNEYLVEAYKDLTRYYRGARDTLAESDTYLELITYLAGQGRETPTLLNGYAWRMSQLEVNLEDALLRIRRARQLLRDEDARTRAGILDTEAELLWKMGYPEQAVSVIEECIRLQPEDEYFLKQKAKFLES